MNDKWLTDGKYSARACVVFVVALVVYAVWQWARMKGWVTG